MKDGSDKEINIYDSKDELDQDTNDIVSIPSNMELKAEFEQLQEISAENCVILKKLSILRKFNESNLNYSPKESLQNDFSISGGQRIEQCINFNYFNDDVSNNSITTGFTSTARITNTPNKTLSFIRQNTSNILKKQFSLLENEIILIEKNNTLIYMHCDKQIEGEFMLTNFRVIFNPYNSSYFLKDFVLPELFQIPYSFITSVTKKKECHKYKFTLKLQMRDRPNLIFHFENKHKYKSLYYLISEMINPKEIGSHFAFTYNSKFNDKKLENGWMVYQQLLEYIRQGVNIESETCNYQLYIQELHGQICDSYPNFLYIHKKISNEAIKKVAKFRSKKRFPAMVWRSMYNNSSLWRSSQAKTGFIDKRSTYDELFFEILSKETEKFHIYDARPYINALANKIRGMGFENTDNYKNAQMIFCDIDNIHIVRLAYNNVRNIAQLNLEGYDNWLIDLHNTNWLQLISKIIKSSINIASSLMENATVLIHCSDGWDRTAQLTSLSQINVDPYFRTFKGIMVLIEKEWVSFGHQFALRCGLSIPKNEDQISPIFTQWLDCVHQLVTQFPDMFEFNNDLLLYIAYHAYSCLYGTFLMNSEREQLDQFIKFKTASIWTDVIVNKSKFINLSYDEFKSSKTILTPSCAIYKLRFWEEHFLRWNPYYIMSNHQKLASRFL